MNKTEVCSRCNSANLVISANGKVVKCVDCSFKLLTGKLGDPVNQPSHYTYGDIETIDYIEQVASIYPSKQAVSAGKVIKYISRAPLKNGLEDLEKAQYYLNRLIELEVDQNDSNNSV